MKKLKFKFIALLLLFLLIIVPNFFIVIGNSSPIEITPKYGNAPKIDGYLTDNAWDDAYKTTTYLNDLLINLWVLQSNSNLYFGISYELDLEEVKTEFIGLLISNNTSNSTSNLKDAKIIQFTNLTTGVYNYLDYKIDNNVFSLDTEQNGQGAAKNITNNKYYEFSIPIEQINNDQDDVYLQYGHPYGFNITWGESTPYPSGIKKSTFAIVTIQNPSNPEINPIELSLLIIAIVISSIAGAYLIIYALNIFTLKKKIERITK